MGLECPWLQKDATTLLIALLTYEWARGAVGFLINLVSQIVAANAPTNWILCCLVSEAGRGHVWVLWLTILFSPVPRWIMIFVCTSLYHSCMGICCRSEVSQEMILLGEVQLWSSYLWGDKQPEKSCEVGVRKIHFLWERVSHIVLDFQKPLTVVPGAVVYLPSCVFLCHLDPDLCLHQVFIFFEIGFV